jgi:hypothetical protein
MGFQKLIGAVVGEMGGSIKFNVVEAGAETAMHPKAWQQEVGRDGFFVCLIL